MRALIAAAAMLAVSACNIDENRTDDLSAYQFPSGSAADWPSGGRDYSEQHFGPLNQISTSTIDRLGLAWSLDLDGEHTLEATPIAVDGILYFSGQGATVYAVRAVDGSLLWKHDPETWKPRPMRQRLIFPANRGVAYWNGKVFVGTRDGRLVALDAKTGGVRWSADTLDASSERYITGAPRAFKNTVVIGNGGGDNGERGYLTAYDSETGKQLWRFYTAPGDPSTETGDPAMALAAKTWRGRWWEIGTGGTVWDSVTYDPELDRLYIGTGNSGPYNPEIRSPGGGDNLFIASIVAVDASTGRYLWHYQVNPREAWDFKATASMVMATLRIDGKSRKVLMQSPTNGFFYVLDRTTGTLISAEKIGKTTWAERIDIKSGRPVEAPNIRYENGPATFWPSPFGVHNWQAMSFSPQTGLVYVPTMKLAARFTAATNARGTIIDYLKIDPDDATGALVAWDPVEQKERWRVQQRMMWNGGVLSTGGNLVFQGDADGHFKAFDARNGKQVWDFDAKLGIVGAPITYSAAGKQYISVLVGFGGATALQSKFGDYGWKYGEQPRRLLTFALDGRALLPPTAPRRFGIAPVDPPSFAIDAAAVQRGALLYGEKRCVMCHGGNLVSAGVPAPDLRESGIAGDLPAFTGFLRTGPSVANGMPIYPEITRDQAHDLYHYIRAGARAASEGRAVVAVKPIPTKQ